MININFLEKIVNANFNNPKLKYTYLYNELFISVFSDGVFLLYSVSSKSGKLLINKYKGEETTMGKILHVIIKKYELVFLEYIKENTNNMSEIGYESDFINIYDRKDIDYNNIIERLSFTFLDDYNYRRRSEMDFNIEEKSVLDIYHSDFECSKCSGPVESFTNFPNYRKDIIDRKYFQEEKSSKNKYTSLKTYISDYESITVGGNPKINEILSDKKLIKDYDLIKINKTCISIIMGDDINSVFSHNNISKDKYFYTDQNVDSGYRAVINYLKNFKIINNNKKKKDILFFGLNKNKNTYEITDLLKTIFGINVGNVLLPNINRKDLEEILNYNFCVFFNGKVIKSQSIFKLYPIDSFESDIPYSLTKNYNLYKNILLMSSKDNLIDKLDSLFDEDKRKNKLLFDKSKGQSVGFIINDYHLKYFITDNFRGVPILSMLKDMGFTVKFFIYPSDDSHKDYEEFEKLGYSTIVSKTINDLNNFIEDKSIKLYYSEINNDKRILSKNKIQFSIGDLEYGIQGFYRSFDRLVKKLDKSDYINFNLQYYLNK